MAPSSPEPPPDPQRPQPPKPPKKPGRTPPDGGDPPVAFAAGEQTDAETPIRGAGPAGMRDRPARWDAVDEASDESFPASDPPGRGPG